MKKTLAALLLATTLALSACTGGAAPTPTPTAAAAMSVAEAGQYYLDTVCPTNSVGEALGTAYQAGDLEAFTAAAAAARDAYKEAGVRFGDADVVWPDSVAGNIVVLRDASIALAASYESLSQVTSLEEANAIAFPDSADASAASQAIRADLELSSDPAVSCPQ